MFKRGVIQEGSYSRGELFKRGVIQEGELFFNVIFSLLAEQNSFAKLSLFGQRTRSIDQFQVVGGNEVFYCPPMPTSN